MKHFMLILGLLICMVGAQSQSLATTFDGTSKTTLTYNWTEISSVESIQINEMEMEFFAQWAKVTHETKVRNHVSKNSYISSNGEIVKGVLRDADGCTIGIARFAYVGTSLAGTADIGNDTYKFRPDKDGKYYWELEAPFICGTEDVDHDDLQKPAHKHGPQCHHNDDISSIPSGMRDPQSCVTESIQDVAFVTDDLMTEYGNDLDAILAQIAISDSWAEDIMEDSGFPDVAFFQESVNVVTFPETGSTAGNLQGFSDSLYANPPGIIGSIFQNSTSTATMLYCVGGGGASGAASLSIFPSSWAYLAVLGDNGGIGNYVKMHEYGHSLWGGRHEDQTPNPILYRRAYLGTDGTWGNYVTTMGQGNFGGGVRIYRFSESDPTASWYSEVFEHTFTPVGNADRDMCRRITEEWNRPGIVQTIDITPATPTISADDATTFCDGGSVELSVDAPESGVDYVWSNGVTANSITVTESGTFSCYGQASSTCTGGTSNSISVAVNPLVEITGNPSNVTVFVADPFSLSASGNNVDTYQWVHDGTNISGATSATYSVASATVSDAGSYHCELTNSCGSENTSTATVTVSQPFANYTPSTTSVGSSSGNVYSDFETNDVSAVNVLTGDPGGVVSPINMGIGITNVEFSHPINLDLVTKQFVITATTSPSNLVVTWTIDQDGAVAFIEADPDLFNLEAAAGSETFDIDCNPDLLWDITGVASWMTLSQYSGIGLATITINYDENTEPNSRSDEFSISGSGAMEVVTVNQVGANANLEAYADSDKEIYFIGETIQLYGSATGGTGSYSYEWTGTGGFSSSEQNPTFDPTVEAEYTFTLIVNDGDNNTATDDVVVNVYELFVTLESSTQTAIAGVPVNFTITSELGDGNTATVDETIFETNGDVLSGFVNPWNFDYTYQNVGGTPFDVEITIITSTGYTYNISYPNYMDVITDVHEASIQINALVYPNPTNGPVTIKGINNMSSIQVYNLGGQLVGSFHFGGVNNSETIDVSSLPIGLYVAKILSNKESKVSTVKINIQ